MSIEFGQSNKSIDWNDPLVCHEKMPENSPIAYNYSIQNILEFNLVKNTLSKTNSNIYFVGLTLKYVITKTVILPDNPELQIFDHIEDEQIITTNNLIDNVYDCLSNCLIVAKYSNICHLYVVHMIWKLHQNGICFTLSNWRKLIFTMIIISQKFLDDDSTPTPEFVELWSRIHPKSKSITINQLVQMEWTIFELLGYNCVYYQDDIMNTITIINDWNTIENRPEKKIRFIQV